MSRLVVTPDWEPGSSPLSTAPGMHRLVWDLRAALPPELTSRRSEGDSGLRVPPSGYTVSAKFGGDIRTRELEVRRDPRVPGVTIPDLHDQYSFLRQIQDERVTLGAAMGQADGLRKQVAAARGKASPAGTAALDAAARSIDRAAGPSRAGGEFAEEPEDAEPANLRRVSGSLERLSRSVESADAAPTPDEIAGFAKRRDRVRASLARWREWLATELPKVNGPIEAAGLPPLSLATDRSSAPRSRTE
jgi:hypothetical protein